MHDSTLGARSSTIGARRQVSGTTEETATGTSDSVSLDAESLSRVGIALALSGGGFRATLFHLGVLAAFWEHDLLHRITRIASVSGGSVLGAHLVLKWSNYVNGDFMAATQALLRMIRRHNLRGSIVRKLPYLFLGRLLARAAAFLAKALDFLLPAAIHLWLKARARRWTATGQLVAAYDEHLFDGAVLSDLKSGAIERAGESRPSIQILSTNISLASTASFGGDGFCPHEPDRDDVDPPSKTRCPSDVEKPMCAELLRVSEAVGASSAFPAYFTPIVIEQSRCHWENRSVLPTQIYLTDGGVIDNIGVKHMLDERNTWVFVSDASATLDWDVKPARSRILANLVRTIDLMNYFNGRMRLAFADRRRRTEKPEELPPNVVRIGIDEEVPIPSPDPGVLTNQGITLTLGEARKLRSVRTDFDTFSSVEIGALVQHGYCVARERLQKAGHKRGKHRIDWSQWPVLESGFNGIAPIKRNVRLSESHQRSWHLFHFTDIWSMLTITLLFWVLSGVTDFLVERQKQVQRREFRERLDGLALAHALELVESSRDLADTVPPVDAPGVYVAAKGSCLPAATAPETPDYSKYRFLDDDRVFFFTRWDPKKREINGNSYVDVVRRVRVRKVGSDDRLWFRFKTTGTRLRVWTWPDDRVAKGATAYDSNSSLPIWLDLPIDTSQYKIGEDFVLTLRMEYENAFEAPEQRWGGALIYTSDPHRISTVLAAGTGEHDARRFQNIRFDVRDERDGTSAALVEDQGFDDVSTDERIAALTILNPEPKRIYRILFEDLR